MGVTESLNAMLGRPEDQGGVYSLMAQKGWPRCLMRVNPQIVATSGERYFVRSRKTYTEVEPSRSNRRLS